MVWKKGGYHSVLKALINNTPNFENQLSLLLNKKVTHITQNGSKMEVKTLDNSVYNADHVICTASLGVLKQKRITFDPPLPKEKIDAIESLGFEGVVKLILHYPEKWWDESKFLFLWNPKDVTESGREFSEGFVTKDGVSWVTSVYALSQTMNPNALIAWISGPMVPEIEALSEATIKNGISYVVKKFLGNDYQITDPDFVIRYLLI